MTDAKVQLIRCFQAVFPKLSESEVVHATASNVAAWDSVATVTLAAAVEEEFDIQLDMEEIEKMDSFESYLHRLNSR